MGEKEQKQIPADLNLHTITELEGMLGLSHRTIWRYIKSGRLKAVKLGNKWAVSDASLRAFLDGQTQS